MRISEVIDFDSYYRDPRFAEKKPDGRSWRKRCGDNIYFRDVAGRWVQARAFYHTSPELIEQDTRYARVFVSDHYFYFGENAPALPAEFASLVQTRQGCTYHEGETVQAFIEWLEQKYQPGVHGEPRDREEEAGRQCGLTQGGSVITQTKNCT
jgi:hypothetical protein